MSKVLKSPGKYVQGRGVVRELDKYLQGMGKHLMILQTEGGMKRNANMLNECFEGKGYIIDYEVFSGESTTVKCEAFAERCRANGTTAIIGIGGGKVLDTAKGVSHLTGLPDVIVPTVCSTDAPCSSLSIMYNDDGVFDRYFFLNNCPNVVIVDSEIISRAPVRLLVAGMGDALATYFEARACRVSGSDNQIQAKPTMSASEMAALCWKYLKADGVKAKTAVEAGVVTEALENIIEVNTYLSSVGFESGGLAAAHGIQKGFTVIPELHNAYHGENVAFCTLVQLILENASEVEYNEVAGFCLDVGLPVCFADLGYSNVEREMIKKAAEKACVTTSTIHHLPFEVTPKMVEEALIIADLMGNRFKGLHI
ncbi:MAG: glycerol dehydrogenase [Clostridiales bacterium]|nr:glycerol dehydrogenase [Clostridiales bacterium]